MSLEDEIEMKDLLMQTLTDNGCLAKIRAQLRASVFLALEEDVKLNSKKPLLNDNLKNCLDSPIGQLMFCIVKEFLEFFNLQSTLAVFSAESYLGVSCQYNGRKKVSQELGLNEDNTSPLLHQLINLCQQKTKTPDVNLSMMEKTSEKINNCGSLLKTDNNLNVEANINNSSLTIVEEYDPTINDTCSSDNSKSTYKNEVNLNKTFTTEPNPALKQIGLHTNLMEQLFNDKQISSEEVTMNPIQCMTLPVPASDRIDEVTTPILKDLKISVERVKSPPKSEKFKSKNNLNSLSDLPSLNMNKCKPGTILPSLYTKEFKEKPNS
ncbi:hypothetical protein WA026_020088 [Henosepilachna vigintioctopunctata]|uniref:FGFR1 oncogene partner (FOP) N-terminal dimerisation domain-containing protein n=1 Tax=Henosepilachna vigintioctopunctata TaxID=420089 RepID=A0AAW1U9T1_9CUCU